jgi:hypothetical protein
VTVTTMTQTHALKSWPAFFQPIVAGTRGHELRCNDRGFATGDTLKLHEYDPVTKSFTGATATAKVTSMTSESQPCAVSEVALGPGYCIMSIRVLGHSPARSPYNPTDYEQAQEIRWRLERGEFVPGH